MVRLVNCPGAGDDRVPRSRPTYLTCRRLLMTGRLLSARDPFEGSAARRRHLRVRIESTVAFALAVAACGFIAAVWVQFLSPLGKVIGLG